jgi:hypothetical protein
MTFDEIVKRVNRAGNFWADTSNVDYCEGLSRREIMAQDRENQDLARRKFFRKELGALGY